MPRPHVSKTLEWFDSGVMQKNLNELKVYGPDYYFIKALNEGASITRAENMAAASKNGAGWTVDWWMDDFLESMADLKEDTGADYGVVTQEGWRMKKFKIRLQKAENGIC